MDEDYHKKVAEELSDWQKRMKKSAILCKPAVQANPGPH
jgi:hypothetical protein